MTMQLLAALCSAISSCKLYNSYPLQNEAGSCNTGSRGQYSPDPCNNYSSQRDEWSLMKCLRSYSHLMDTSADSASSSYLQRTKILTTPLHVMVHRLKCRKIVLELLVKLPAIHNTANDYSNNYVANTNNIMSSAPVPCNHVVTCMLQGQGFSTA